MTYPGRLLISAYDITLDNHTYVGPKPFTALNYNGQYLYIHANDLEMVKEDINGVRQWDSQYSKLFDPIWFLNIIFTWQEGER